MLDDHCIVKLSKNYCDYENDLAIHIGLFKNVSNINDLCEKAIQQNAAFIDASLIISLEQLLIAVNKSLYSRAADKNRLDNLYTDLLFNLSVSKNIHESLKQFGIEKLKNETSANIIVITIDKSLVPEIFTRINGNLYQPSSINLANTCDKTLIQKIYKTNDLSLIETKIASKDYLL